METHTVGVTRWITEVSPTLYAEPQRFSHVFIDFYNKKEDHMSAQNLRTCFATSEEMEKNFTIQDQDKVWRKENMRVEWTKKNKDFNNTMNDMCDLFRNDNIRKDM